jgi:hypothetical protein
VSEEAPTEKTLEGRVIKYTTGDEQIEVHGYRLDDGGVYWRFVRAGDVYPLSLSKKGMEAMLSIWHDLTWGRDSVMLRFKNDSE